jgi:hypothetical protein
MVKMKMIPDELHKELIQHGITAKGEVALREALEAHTETYTLIKLASWPARRWKCQYRLLIGDKMYDAQSASEAYALALLALLENTHS